jgi:Domain of unknown function (DUF4158)
LGDFGVRYFRSLLVALPNDLDDLIRYYTLTDLDYSLIRQRHGDANRLAFTIQLCLLRYPRYGLPVDDARYVRLARHASQRIPTIRTAGILAFPSAPRDAYQNNHLWRALESSALAPKLS